MRENSLIAACAMIAVLGVVLLFVLARFTAPERLDINELSNEDLGKYVSVKSRVSSVADYASNTKIKLCSKRCLNVVVWQNVAWEMREKALDLAALKPGQIVEAKGILKEWRNELELVTRDWRAIEVVG